MRFWRLCRAEIIKIFRQPGQLYFALFVIGMAFFAPLVVSALAWFDPETNFNTPRMLLWFPRSVDTAVAALWGFGIPITGALVALTVGSEYGRGTLRLVLPKIGSRAALLNAKALVLLGYVPLLFGAGIGVYVAMSWLCTEYVLGIGNPATTPHMLASTFAVLAGIAFRLLFYGALTGFVTILTRSVLGGALAGVLAPLLLELLTFRAIAVAMPSVQAQNIEARLTGSASQIASVSDLMGCRVSMGVSMAIIVAYAVALVVASVVLFERRDVLSA